MDKMNIESKDFKEIAKCLAYHLEKVIEHTKYGVDQWQQAYSPDEETNQQKVLKTAQTYIKLLKSEGKL